MEVVFNKYKYTSYGEQGDNLCSIRRRALSASAMTS
jgi:hypothetical protein